MHDRIQERCIRIGQYIADTGATVRGAARHFGVSKSSVHKDMDERLPRINQTLYRQVRRVLSYNKSVRRRRGHPPEIPSPLIGFSHASRICLFLGE